MALWADVTAIQRSIESRMDRKTRRRFRRMLFIERIRMNLVQFFYDRIPAYARWVERQYGE
jgi:hypothetical protein